MLTKGDVSFLCHLSVEMTTKPRFSVAPKLHAGVSCDSACKSQDGKMAGFHKKNTHQTTRCAFCFNCLPSSLSDSEVQFIFGNFMNINMSRIGSTWLFLGGIILKQVGDHQFRRWLWNMQPTELWELQPPPMVSMEIGGPCF